MDRRRFSKAVGLLLTASVAVLPAACSEKEPEKPSGPVTITVNGLPPESDPVNRKSFLDDVKAFEAANANIKIDAKEGFMDPQTFATKLAGGQLEDVFYTYFTDPGNLIAKRQVADISAYTGEFPAIAQLRPDLMKVYSGADGKVYGIPTKNYSMGLLYNRTLFTKAGLDPNSPPKTWEEVRTAAQKIAALGGGTVGYGDYSKSNTGGWHFTAEIYSLGGDIAVKDGDTWKAAFNSDKGKQVLQQLKDMRWTDNTMGARQQLEWADLLQMMASGKLGMYVATSDNIPTIVNQFKGDFKEYGLGPVPGGAGTLAGGEGFMFNAKATPEKIRAGLKWLTFRYTNPDRIEQQNKTAADAKQPVGLPEPLIWTGAAAEKQAASSKSLANVPTENYAPFVSATASIPLKLEPPQAQQIYAVLDTAMLKVLTDKNADIAALLADAEKQVNTILAAVK
ncbi:sugar ABC transporter substrate-binding protein [Catellatospora sp. TT07R-123]|uniref:ABC transporter substrate-binding protein n=1 Tax=Catellatospora sp. TT07R-123 TaxID=2733863 RepID=UPI001B1826D0|nr:extracellular solute-binding protein [Catellatospora sp. TT07R-123]GHJ49610.1 sugar ABC transporter substrate-binding protein [Catellatospora sp. TT07R-123]